MSVAYYIVLDNERPGFNTYVNGEAIGKAADAIDCIANQLSLPVLDDFLSLSNVELETFLDEKPPLVQIEETWFHAAEGIVFFERLAKYLQNNPHTLDNVHAVLKDLEEYQKILHNAFKINAKWHLCLDFWVHPIKAPKQYLRSLA